MPNRLRASPAEVGYLVPILLVFLVFLGGFASEGGCSHQWKRGHTACSVLIRGSSIAVTRSSGWPSENWYEEAWTREVSTQRRGSSFIGITLSDSTRKFMWNPSGSGPPAEGAGDTEYISIYYREVCVHIAHALALAALPLPLWVHRILRRRRRAARQLEGRCENCGYDLRGALDQQCPECGEVGKSKWSGGSGVVCDGSIRN